MAANERLDAIGRLLIDPEDDPVKETAWTGDSTGARLVNPVPGTGSQQPTPARGFRQVLIGGVEVSIGDHIYLTADAQGAPCEIARVRGMYELDHVEEEDDDRHFLEVQYFWRPEHLRTLPQPLSVRSEREVFLAENVDSIPTDAFEAKCTLVQLPEGADVPPHLLAASHTFHFCRVYNPLTKAFARAGGVPGGEAAVSGAAPGAPQAGAVASSAAAAANSAEEDPASRSTTATDEAGSDGAAAAAAPPPPPEKGKKASRKRKEAAADGARSSKSPSASRAVRGKGGSGGGKAPRTSNGARSSGDANGTEEARDPAPSATLALPSGSSGDGGGGRSGEVADGDTDAAEDEVEGVCVSDPTVSTLQHFRRFFGMDAFVSHAAEATATADAIQGQVEALVQCKLGDAPALIEALRQRVAEHIQGLDQMTANLAEAQGRYQRLAGTGVDLT